MNNMRKLSSEVIFAVIAIALGVLTRTYLDLGQNIEMITAFGIVSGFFFKDKKLAYAVPLVSMILSDVMLTNTNIFLFTWSGFLFGPLIGSVLNKVISKTENKLAIGLVSSQFAGIVATIVFFLWTNFGVWLIGNMYVKNLSGLVQSYINGLPFLSNQFIGNLIIVPIVFVASYLVFNYKSYTYPIKKFLLDK